MALIGELTFYWLVAGVMGVVTLVVAAMVADVEPDRRRVLLPVPAITGVLVLSYVAMANEFLTVPDSNGNPITTARFLGYFFTYTVVVLYLGWIVDARRRLTFVGSGLVAVFTIAVLANWFLEGAISALPPLVLVASLGTLLWIMLRPMTRAADAVSGERALLFGKLRNLLALVWLLYLIVGATSRQGAGLLDSFTGVYLGAYLDIIGHAGFAFVLLRAEDALDDLREGAPPLLTYLRGEDEDTSTVTEGAIGPADD